MTSRSELQRKCAELKRLGKLRPGERCNAPTEVLLEIVNRESLVSATQTPLALTNDLITVIATYTTPSLTLTLLATDTNLARTAYSENAGLWRSKANFEALGLVLDNSVILADGSWRKYYLLINRNFFGDVYTARSPTRPQIKPKLLVRGASGIAGPHGSFDSVDVVRGSEVHQYEVQFTNFFAGKAAASDSLTITYPRRIRQAAGTNVVITEAGEIYNGTGPGGRRLVGVGSPEAYYVSMDSTASYFLDRDGGVFAFPRVMDETSLVPVRVVGRAVSVSTPASQPVVLLSNGNLIETAVPTFATFRGTHGVMWSLKPTDTRSDLPGRRVWWSIEVLGITFLLVD